MGPMRRLAVVWGCGLAVVGAITLTFRSESTCFYGIAETQEQMINVESAVEVKAIHVVPGQSVARGDLLVELIRPDLALRINEVTHAINEVVAQKDVDRSEGQALLVQLNAQRLQRISEIDARIAQLKAQYALNVQLTSQLKSVRPDSSRDSSRGTNPLLVQIESLQHELDSARDPTLAQIHGLSRSISTSAAPKNVQLEQLREELEVLAGQMDGLHKRSPIDGVVGSVNVRDGERVSPFSPILTVHARSPSYVKGYIHENTYNQVRVGQQLEVRSLAERRTRLIGEVAGVGGRIVEFPVRLRKHPDILVWGREVLVRIPPQNPLLLGEKVMIRCAPGF
jgi:multidrug resistance efflux pump